LKNDIFMPNFWENKLLHCQPSGMFKDVDNIMNHCNMACNKKFCQYEKF